MIRPIGRFAKKKTKNKNKQTNKQTFSKTCSCRWRVGAELLITLIIRINEDEVIEVANLENCCARLVLV